MGLLELHYTARSSCETTLIKAWAQVSTQSGVPIQIYLGWYVGIDLQPLGFIVFIVLYNMRPLFELLTVITSLFDITEICPNETMCPPPEKTKKEMFEICISQVHFCLLDADCSRRCFWPLPFLGSWHNKDRILVAVFTGQWKNSSGGLLVPAGNAPCDCCQMVSLGCNNNISVT